MPDRLNALQDVLLVQCVSSELNAVLELADRPGVGVAVSTRQHRDVHALADAVGPRPALADAGCYIGAARKQASAPFDPTWLQVQRDAGLAVLTDSGYLAEHDTDGLTSILKRAGHLGDVIAVLPMHPWWLDARGGLGHLVEQVENAGVPIAVVLEHRDDPFGVVRTLRGMLTLLRVHVPVIQLRCDVSGLGVLCHGAHAAAVGTQTRLRHLYPITKSGGGDGRPAAIATLVRECLSYISVDKIALAVQGNPDDSLWTACTCPTCNGRQLGFIAGLPDPTRQQHAAFGHALDMLFTLRDGLLGQSDPQNRKLSWRAHCDNALARYLELDRDGQHWRPPRFLNNWYEVPVPSTTP